MNNTDYLRLNDLKIFKNVCDSLPKGLTKSTNLLIVKDGVLFTWDFDNNCVLTLNIKAARSRDGDNVSHQNLLSQIPVLFQPEFLVANDRGTLLIVAGCSGISVMELPARYPPYGAFENNKDVVYCKSHSLDERLLFFNETIKVRQVRFHPGSPQNNHILALTSDNTLRLYSIENSTALSVATYQIGETPIGVFPGSKTSYLATYGEVGVDFVFGHPDIEIDTKSLFLDDKNSQNLLWPVYVVNGNGNIFTINIPLDQKFKPVLTGPLRRTNQKDNIEGETCSIICFNTIPEVIVIANSNGSIYHFLVLPVDEKELQKQNPNAARKQLLVFECIELELGLSTTGDNFYTCPIFLHKDESRSDRYFVTHSAGIHSVTVSCFKDLQTYINGDDDTPLQDIFNQKSKAEYLVCTKISSSEKTNPVIGFSLYYEPTSLISILADGSLLSLGILTAEILPKVDELMIEEKHDSSNLKVMLNEPFENIVETLLKKSSSQPILKLGGGKEHTQKECYEILQRASQIFREQFDNHTKARQVIEKRFKALQMMKDFQLKEIDRLNAEKNCLRENAERFAEKYEECVEKQDVLLKRCEKLLVLESQKRAEPSDAEREFLKELEVTKEKVKKYQANIEKLKMKMNYQKIQITNWKMQEGKKMSNLSEGHLLTINSNLKEQSEAIQEMVKEIKEYKEHLSLK